MTTMITVAIDLVTDIVYCSNTLSRDDVEKIKAFIEETIQRSAGDYDE